MEKKKILICFIMFILLTGLVTCCGQENQREENAAVDAKNEKYGYDSPVKIKVGLSYAVDLTWIGDETPEDNAWMDLYKENNIFPEILYSVNESQAESRLESAIMSGNYPDVFCGGLQEYKNWADNGVSADITEAYEKYATDELKKYLESDGGKGLEMLKIDGRLYGLPRIDSPYEQIPVMFIRQDWLDRLGLEIPTTMEELKTVAHAFTYDDPDGNGVDDTYGIGIDGINVVNNTVGDCSPIFAAFGVYLGNDTMAFVEGENGEPVWGGTNISGMHLALQFLQELYADGSICKDAVTMDSNAVFEDAGEGRCGIWFGPVWGGMVPASDAAKKDINARISAVSIPSGQGREIVKEYLPSSVRSITCVSSQCENPEVLIKLMNLSVQKVSYPESEEEYRKYLGDNENYTGSKTSLIYVQDTQNYEGYKKLKKALETGDSSELNLVQKMDMAKMESYLRASEDGEFDPNDSQQSLGISYYTVYGGEHSAWSVIDKMIQEDAFVYPVYNDLMTNIMIEKAATLKYMTVEMIIKIMAGQDVSSYNQFLDVWYAAGGQDIVDEVNLWYEQNRENKK
ncbi:extracellular solute-binding protein [Faecalimonas umbilicata]|nr:extracellular solute-binding protein [Faecalimonas umbilicata]